MSEVHIIINDKEIKLERYETVLIETTEDYEQQSIQFEIYISGSGSIKILGSNLFIKPESPDCVTISGV